MELCCERCAVSTWFIGSKVDLRVDSGHMRLLHGENFFTKTRLLSLQYDQINFQSKCRIVIPLCTKTGTLKIKVFKFKATLCFFKKKLFYIKTASKSIDDTDKHIRSNLGFRISPKDTSTCRAGQTSDLQITRHWLYP